MLAIPLLNVTQSNPSHSRNAEVFRKSLNTAFMKKTESSVVVSVVKDLIEAGATLETLQQRIMMQAYFTVPVMSVSAAGIPSHMINSRSGPYQVRIVQVTDGWLHELSGCCTSPAGGPTPFERVHGKSVWELAGENAGMSQVINDAMVSDTILVMPVFVQCCDKLLNGNTSMVDIGGGVGMTMSYIVKVFPHIKCTVFDLPHVIAASAQLPGVEMVGGDMFKFIPPADAIFLKAVGFPMLLQFMLHNWHDKECITILKKCKEVIPQDKGKVVILDIVTDQNEQDDDLTRAKMNLS
ncbi:hypothetical protein IFM89_023124 [Coptis chinensis]|uniref:O-methyltransferase C-terminal domain-containing protein n=1 Tax=Coptis chinensis TaxID=261450 RepID=A0A835M0D9_9MAGN|nr:hypothetical protein IFM89_023124 [Coptis chinensis]